MAFMGRKHTLLQKSIIEKTSLKLGVIILSFLANFKYELISYSRQSLPSPDPLQKQMMAWIPAEWLENQQKLIVVSGIV